jgi:transcriptional regulator with XRE-family HTH domain
MTPHPLKVERELRGWSQAKVAKILGTTTRTIGRWEQGQAIPYPHYREQLCALFGKNALELGISTKSDDNKSIAEARTLIETTITALDEQTVAGSSYLLDPAIPEMPGRAGDLAGRDDLLLQAKQSLLENSRFPVIAFHGLPGIGKTALAVALAMDQQVQARFCDGILWGSLGPCANALDQLMRWGALLGISPHEVENVNSCTSWRHALRMHIGTRRLLIIIDDAWSAEDAPVLQVGGAYCAHILTTRQPQVAFAFAQEEAILIPELEEIDALALLARFVPLLAQQTSEDALTLVRAVAGIPLALTLMGKYLARQAFTGQPRRLQSAITRLQAVEQRFHVSMPVAFAESSSGQSSSIPISIYTTIASSTQRLSSSARATLCALAAFPPKPASFSESAALSISQQPVEALDELWDAGLLESSEPGRYMLHRTISDFSRLLYAELRGDQQQIEVSTHSFPLSPSPLSPPQIASEKIESSLLISSNCKDTSQ